ncbi:PREDICTED: immunoglobulin-like and fibronectin type III domain-containing protein 1 isoform X14 [Aptenodytes forsteri]|uniref:immunoglobulin-like and fibronectin type III domain-containing protein 1 isoform X14 n=1 Tax=Aptenodytes forsteri TaxID=9233 RepID=UPI000904949C|nr:PREDICTED: immunoglobulin-like and fibronectin type III domain-containing protein 1 isoform X14 [Aptenodytes forsteri]
MTSHQAVKSFKKSSVPGVVITQFVDDIPEGCSTPDFERKPVTLTLQEGKNAIFRAVVKGVPTPDVKWTRLQGGMDDPAKYETFFNNVTNEFILQINRLTTDDSDLYRCFAVNEYGEAACSAGLRIIQVGFKRKAKYIPVHPADELKKQLQDFRKLLRKRAPAPRPKLLDKEAVWQLLLHADRRDYEKICMKYGIVDFRGMLRKLQEMRKDTESEQGELIHSVKNFQHIKVNKEGKATFSLELDLKNSNSKVYLLKDGKRLRYGMESEYRKHCLRRIGKRYNFIVNDVQPEDAGLYQVKVKDVPVFSTELDAESIPVRFEQLLSDVRCPEEEDAVFECILRTPCYDAVWLHKTHLLEESEKHQISVTPDGLTHQLIIKNIVPSDNGMYTLDTGLCSSNAWLIVEYAKGKRRQGEGGEREKSEWLKETLPDEDRAKKLRRREYVGDEDHLMDTGVEEDGWYRNGQGGSEGHSTDVDGSHRFLGKHRLRGAHRNGRTGFGQFSGADLDGDSMTYDGISFGLKGLGGKSGLRPFHGKDSMTGRADTGDELGGEGEWYSVDGRDDGMLDAVKIDMDDGEGVGSQLDKDGKLGDTSYRDGFGGVGRLGASDGSSVLDGLNPDSTGVGGGKGDLLSRTSPGTGARKNAAGTEIAGGMRSPYGKDGLPTVVDMNGASINREGQKGTPYGKDGLTIHASGHLGQAGRSGLQCGPGGLPAGDGAISGAGDSSIGEMEALYDPDGQPLGAGVGDAGVAGAGGFVSRYGKDGLPAGAGIGSAGAGGVGSPHGKDGLTAGAGLGGAGVAGAGGVWSPYGKDGLTPEAGFGGAAVGGFGGVGSPYGKDGLTAAAGVAGLGGVGSLFEKDGLPAGAGISGAGVAGAEGVGSPYGKDGLTAGAGVGVAGAGGVGSLYEKDGLPAGAGVGGAGAGGVGSPYGKDGLTAGAGLGGAGAGGVGFPYGKDGLPARSGLGGAGVAGAEGVGSPYGKDDLTAGAGIGGAGVAGAGGVGSLHGKNSLPAGAGVAGAGGFSSLYGKDGLPAGAGVGGSGVDGAEGIGSHHGKDGLPVGMGTGAGTGVAGFGGFGSPYGKDGLPAGAGAGVAGARGIVSFYGKDGLPTGAVTGAAHFPFGGEEVMGSHHGRDAMLSRAQAYMGGAGGDGFSSEGGGVSGSAILSAGSPYGKDSGSAGAKAGEGGVGRLGSDQRELHLVRGKEGVVGAVGRGGEYELDSHPGKSSMGDETGKGTASDFRGSGNRGSSHDRDSLSGQGDARGEGRDLGQLGSLYGKNSAFGGSGSKSRNRSVDGRNSGGFGQGSLDYGQMSDLYGGPPSINQRKQEPGVDIKANDFLKNTESMGKRRCYCLDDLKAPRCHLNKHLLDVRVLKGEPAELSCTVSKDEVTGTWFKDGLKLTSMDGIFFEKEGLVHKLIINKVEDIHAGKYRFEGGDIKTEASVFVEDPPQVDKVLLKNLSVPTVAKAGQKVKIKIPFEGRLPVRATWLKDRMELADDTRIRVDKTETFIMLSISSSERKDCGDYKVRLKNDSGVLEINFKLVVTDKPQPPAGPIKIVESTANDITIEWKPPKDDGGKPLQSYIVERQQVGENDWVTLGETPRSCTTFTTNKVEQDMSYYFRVRAVNAEGTSDALESDEVKAVSKASPGAPDPPKIVSASRDTITISWKAPCKTGSSQIVGYIVQKRKKGTVTWLPVNSVPIADKKLKMTNLKKGLQYEFRVAAVNAAGIGDASEPSQPVFARDSMESPGQVQDLKVSSSDSTSVTLTWKRPEAKDGSDVKGYDVEMRSSNNLNWTKCNTLPIEVTTYTVKGLQAKEMYFLRVRALNDSGPGEAAELEACIEAAPPVVSPRLLIDDTVKSLLVIKAGNTIRVNIPFEASPDPVVTWLKDGLPLPNQTTINTKDGTTQLLIGAAELTDSGTYTVELQNGLGKRETFSFQVQVTDIPQSPGPIQLEENVPNTVTVTWEPSASEKWENNLYYTVLKRESQKGLWHVVGDLIYTNKFTFTKLIPGRDYYFRVVAKNNLGASGPSESVQPWRIRKPKAEFQVKPQKYRRVNQNQPPRFLVPLKPHVVTTGSECRMSCAVGGHPPPKITWYKDNSDVSNDRTYFCTNDFGVCSLVVLGVTKHDEGEYMVEATNELGRASSKAFLTIKDSTL